MFPSPIAPPTEASKKVRPELQRRAEVLCVMPYSSLLKSARIMPHGVGALSEDGNRAQEMFPRKHQRKVGRGQSIAAASRRMARIVSMVCSLSWLGLSSLR